MAPIFSVTPILADPQLLTEADSSEQRQKEMFFDLASQTLQLITQVLDTKLSSSGDKHSESKSRVLCGLSMTRVLRFLRRSVFSFMFLAACVGCGWLWVYNVAR